ncbi:MAG: TldD/PmbA family protein [Planctomycetes bacterium]|nr:TldD/PmbA family protein [Planctomycetota bacterium]
MKAECLEAIDAAKSLGANYADVRVIEYRREGVALRNGHPCNLASGQSFGAGIRVIVNGAWGFASTNQVTAASLKATSARAVEIAKASAQVKKQDVRLAPKPPVEDIWCTPFTIDPFKVPLEQKLGLLLQIDTILRKNPAVKVASAAMQFAREKQWYMDTDGSFIVQDLLRSGAGYSATAVGNGEVQIRSYPQSWGGNHKCMGYEIVHAYDLLGNAERIRDEAVALLTAPACPSGRMDLILDGPQLALQIHESVGHANELDRVFGYEANYAGRSFMLPELHNRKGGFKYGSPIVNLVADCTVPGGLATIGYDDDGVRAQRFHVVQNGIHNEWFTTRETAPLVDREVSNGCNRAEGFNNIPITRIPNLSLMPGEWEYDALIADTKDGIIMEVNKSWSIDQMRLNFQFGAEIGRVIKDGKITGIVKNPNYQGNTPEFWGACDAICNQDHWDLWGVINCGKGQPGQTAEMSHGGAPTRFRGVEVGIRG